jgi:hypothetical protein
MSMNHRRLFPLVLSVLVAFSGMIVQPTAAFSSPAWSAGIGKSTTTTRPPLFRSEQMAKGKTSLNVLLASSGSDIDPSPNNESPTFRDRVRKITGISLTAFRATMRPAANVAAAATTPPADSAITAFAETIQERIRTLSSENDLLQQSEERLNKLSALLHECRHDVSGIPCTRLQAARERLGVELNEAAQELALQIRVSTDKVCMWRLDSMVY